MMQLHQPVLVHEVLRLLDGMMIDVFFDGTVGAGGHANAILHSHPEIRLYLGCDRDEDALSIARQNLEQWKNKIHLFHGCHSEIRKWLGKAGERCANAVLIDAGVSSMQLDRGDRGFSFQTSGHLDMRMDQTADLTAEEIVNRWREEDLARILKEYGEEPRAWAVARAIVSARKKKPLKTTADLVEAIRPAAKRKKRLHFATLTFQALRIAVNDELDELARSMDEAVKALCVMGKIAVITFHSLEDRIVKNGLRNNVARKDGSGCLELITKKPTYPTDQEIKDNPRCRSAKLRAARKVCCP
jgi:16S rRNA (cytosine1402-N4)-methyltransferase